MCAISFAFKYRPANIRLASLDSSLRCNLAPQRQRYRSFVITSWSVSHDLREISMFYEREVYKGSDNIKIDIEIEMVV